MTTNCGTGFSSFDRLGYSLRKEFNSQAYFKNRSSIVKSVTAHNDQVIKFSYSDSCKRVAAAILQKDGTFDQIDSSELPFELQLINSAHSFRNYLSDVSIKIVNFAGGEKKIYINRKLLGGDPLSNLLDPLTKHIRLLVNLCLVEDILGCLKKISEDVIDPEGGIEHYFEKLSMPSETKKVISSFVKQIQTILRKSTEVATTMSQLKKRLLLISKELEPKSTFWPQLIVFLSLPSIKALKNEAVLGILLLVKEDLLADQLEKQVTDLLEKEEINLTTLNKEIGKPYINLKTLLKEIVRKKPVIIHQGIVHFWDSDPSLFIGKTISVLDLDNDDLIGIIRRAERKDTGWTFLLNNGIEVLISYLAPSYQIEIQEKLRYSFLNGILTLLNVNDSFEIEKRDLAENIAIEPGNYVLTSRNKVELENKGSAVELIMVGEESYKFIICTIEGSDEITLVSIEKWRKEKSEKLESYIPIHFKSYSVVQKKKRVFLGIKSEIINQQVLIKDETGEMDVEAVHRHNLEEQITQIRTQLLDPSNRDQIEELLDILAECLLLKINPLNVPPSLLIAAQSHIPAILKEVLEIVQETARLLNEQHKPEDLLRDLLLDVNYSLMARREKSLEVLRAMKLLEGAYEGLQKIKNKNLILLMGNTGCGKSATVCYLMNIPQEIVTNKVGQKVVVNKEIEKGDSEAISTPVRPIIGQSLQDSKTVYVSGYSPIGDIDDESLMITDCPGFNDTRGEEYEFCANYCIDNAIANARSIKSIVLTIPVQFFQTDRCNQLIDLIHFFRKRFPDSFDYRKFNESSNYFILVTKGCQTSPEVSRSIENGKFIEELAKETQKKINAIVDSKNSGGEIDSFELERLRERYNIWQCFRKMHQQKMIDVIDIENEFQRQELLNKYKARRGVVRNRYLRGMDNPEMQNILERYVKMSTHTWVMMIKDYLEIFPKETERLKHKIESTMRQIYQRDAENHLKYGRMIELKNYCQELESLLSELSGLGDDSRIFTKDSDEEKKLLKIRKRTPPNFSAIRDKIHQLTNTRLKNLRKDLQDKKKQIESNDLILKSFKTEKKRIEDEITSVRKEISESEKRLKVLSTGSVDKVLFQSNYEKVSEIKVQKHLDGFREIDETNSQLSEEEQKEVEVKKTNDFVGTLYHRVKIKKDFKIAKEPTLVEDIMTYCFYQHYGYSGNIKGKKFTLDSRREVDSERKGVTYFLKTFWDQGKPQSFLPSIFLDKTKIPWFRISHNCLNSDINEVDIRNTLVDVGRSKEHEQQLVTKLSDVEKELEQQQNFLNELKKEENTIDQEFKNLSMTLSQEKYSDLHSEKLKELKQRKLELENLSSSLNLDTSTTSYWNEVENDRRRFEGLIRGKRNLAIAISTQLEMLNSLRLLRELSAEIVKNPVKNQSSIANDCEQFNLFFDQKLAQVKKQTATDLTILPEKIVSDFINDCMLKIFSLPLVDYYKSLDKLKDSVHKLQKDSKKKVREIFDLFCNRDINDEKEFFTFFEKEKMPLELSLFLENFIKNSLEMMKSSSNVELAIKEVRKDIRLLLLSINLRDLLQQLKANTESKSQEEKMEILKILKELPEQAIDEKSGWSAYIKNIKVSQGIEFLFSDISNCVAKMVQSPSIIKRALDEIRKELENVTKTMAEQEEKKN